MFKSVYLPQTWCSTGVEKWNELVRWLESGIDGELDATLREREREIEKEAGRERIDNVLYKSYSTSTHLSVTWTQKNAKSDYTGINTQKPLGVKQTNFT